MPTAVERCGIKTRARFVREASGLGKVSNSAIFSPDPIEGRVRQRAVDGPSGSIVSGFPGSLGLGKARHPRNGGL